MGVRVCSSSQDISMISDNSLYSQMKIIPDFTVTCLVFNAMVALNTSPIIFTSLFCLKFVSGLQQNKKGHKLLT